MTTRYIEIDSTYRNREDDNSKFPGEFRVLSQDTEQRSDRLDDVVSDHVQMIQWRKANFSLDQSDTPTTFTTRQESHGVQLKPSTNQLPDASIVYIGHADELHLTTMITSSGVYNGILQIHDDYYWGCNLSVVTDGISSSARITKYNYIGNNECIITLSNPVVIDESSNVEISDPSNSYDNQQISGKSNAWEFVPGGPQNISYIGAIVYVNSQGISPSSTNPLTYTVTRHDKDRNMIELNNGLNLGLIGPTDQFTIRRRPIRNGSFRNISLHNFFGTSSFPDSNTDFLKSFSFKGGTDINTIRVHDFIEIQKPVEYGHILLSRISETQFTISAAGDPTPSTTNDAYIGCTIRFIMDKGVGDDGEDFVSEDRKITAYVGATRLVTIDKALNNTLSDYSNIGSTVSIMIISDVEIKEISGKKDYNFSAYSQDVNGFSIGGQTGQNILNLLNYSANPSLSTYFDASNWVSDDNSIKPFTSSVDNGIISQNILFGAPNMLNGASGPLKGCVIIWDDSNGGYKYGWIKEHVIQFEGGFGGRRLYKYNYLVIDSDLANNVGFIQQGNSFNFQIRTVDMKSPFSRNPYSNYTVDTKLNLANVIPFTDDNSRRLIIPTNFTDVKEYKVTLVNISLPNKELVCSKGGYITEYPFVYVKLRTKENSNKTNNGFFYSNNPNNNKMDFRVIIDNFVDDITTSHVALRTSDMSIENFKLDKNDVIEFAVFMPDGSRFQTIDEDKMSPFRPNPVLQISALFAFEEKRTCKPR
jgi:hypothetical protein